MKHVAFLALVLLAAAGCRSRHIEINIENHTGSEIRLLEVDYPSASFGADSLAAGANFHYRVQLIGSGPLTISYAGASGKQNKIKGPNLAEPQQGHLDIVLLPDGKAEFHPELSPGEAK